MLLQDLVPPLELCEKIPFPEFVGTYASWVFVWAKEGELLNGEPINGYWLVTEKSPIFTFPDAPPNAKEKSFLKKHFPCSLKMGVICREHYPAPTLQEILDKLPDGKRKDLHTPEQALKLWLSKYEKAEN